jgi:serine/threonine protein kinase
VKPGHVVDRYEIVRPLGVGGMASVYLVRHTLLGSFHALKVLSDELVDDEHVRERFVAEGRIQAQLRHPNIVSVTEIVAVPGIAGLVLQYIDGPTLEDWLEKKGALRPDVIRAVFRPILAAMQTAHASGIVHRDLKPGNILLELQDPEPPIPFVTDFGIAKIAAETQLTHQRKKKTAAMMRLGTLSYMAPEQIERAADVDRRADIFALGAILYEMLAGQLAFDGPTEFAIMQRIVKGEPVPWPEGVALDKRLVACVDRALSPDPADRFPDCGIFLDFLGSSTTSTGIPAPFARRGGPIASESTQPPRPTPDVAKPSTATVADPVRPPAAPDARPTPLPEAAPTYLDPLATPAPAPAVASIPGPAADLPTSAAPPKKVPSKGIRRRWGPRVGGGERGAGGAVPRGWRAWQAPALSLWYATTIHTSEKALLASVWTAPNGTRLRYVPAGTVAMGSDPADPDREVDEGAVHRAADGAGTRRRDGGDPGAVVPPDGHGAEPRSTPVLGGRRRRSVLRARPRGGPAGELRRLGGRRAVRERAVGRRGARPRVRARRGRRDRRSGGVRVPPAHRGPSGPAPPRGRVAGSASWIARRTSASSGTSPVGRPASPTARPTRPCRATTATRPSRPSPSATRTASACTISSATCGSGPTTATTPPSNPAQTSSIRRATPPRRPAC